MRSILIAVTMLAAMTVGASSAPWIAEMVEDEGGEVLKAYVVTDGDVAPGLWISCGADRVGVRYDIGPSSLSIEPGTEADLTFSGGAASETRRFVNEGMDGMFAAYLERDDALVRLMMVGSAVSIVDTAGSFPAATLTLEGSAAAIGRVLASCD